MKATLLYLECNKFSGIMRVLLNNTVIAVELGTPHYNDYGEYRLEVTSMKLSLEEYQKRFPNSPTLNHEVTTLSEEDVKFWENLKLNMNSEDEEENFLSEEDLKLFEISEDGAGRVVCGRGEDEEFYVFFNQEWISYKEYQETCTPNHYNKLMYPLAEIFYQWYNKKLVLDVEPSKDFAVNIYPND